MARHRVTVTIDAHSEQRIQELYETHSYCARHRILRAALRHGLDQMGALDDDAVRRCLAAATESPHE
jgi:metal-responsive CopG/Arc/MetJ family transcriptional regulator